jgi:hypothetical protein
VSPGMSSRAALNLFAPSRSSPCQPPISFLPCRDAAAGGSGRVLDCICCLQDCLADPRPAVAALAMEAVSALTKEDTLDFYTVWQVVNQCLPPQKVLAAAAGSGTVKVDTGAVELAVQMVDLLACAVLDARLYADRAAAILELLWSVAVQHAHPKVGGWVWTWVYGCTRSHCSRMLWSCTPLSPQVLCPPYVVCSKYMWLCNNLLQDHPSCLPVRSTALLVLPLW